MKKILLIPMALLTAVTVFAGTKSNVSAKAADGVNKRSELIKPGADGRVIVTPEIISGVQAVKEKMNAPVKENELDARLKAERLEVEKYNLKIDAEAREMADLHKRQRTEAAAEKARVEEQSRRAPARRGGSVSHGYQWDQPYQAFGDDTMLTRIDMYYSAKNSAFQKFGDEVFTYDASGRVIGTEYTIQNVDGVANQLGFSSGVKIPDNAIIKEVYLNNETTTDQSVYYLDPATGERHDISVYKSVSYNNEIVSMIRKQVNSKGEMVEYGKVESEFDSKGRPVWTVRYRQYTLVDTATGAETWELRPYSKLEYEYPSDNLITMTESYMEYDDDGNGYWVYDYRRTSGTDSDGADYWEYLYYSSLDTAWVGSSKYTRLIKEDAAGREEIETRWSWNKAIKTWQLSEKTLNRYNSKNYRTLYEEYDYSIPLQSFYLYSKKGYEYLGDTLNCCVWNIYYNTPDSLSQLAEPEALAYYGYKNEYMDYTLQELGWTLNGNDYISTPRKYDINYSLDTNNKKSISWIPNYKYEYEYVLASRLGSDYHESFVSDRKYYSWGESDWVLSSENKYVYNEYGDVILSENYQDGQIVSRQTSKYKYALVYSWGDSVYERNTIAEKYWRVVDGQLIPSSEYEYDFDADNNQILYAYYSNWDTLSNKWLYGNRNEYGYDEYGNQNAYTDYDWSANLGIWIGSYKQVEVYSEFGDVLKRETWSNRNDSATVWIPSSFEETKLDANNNVISSESYSSWNGESWEYGYKSEWTYSAEGLLLGECSYNMYSGQWYGETKEEYEYNAIGQITQRVTYWFDDYDIQDWVASEKEVYSYADDNTLLDIYVYKYEDSAWQVSEKQLAVIEDGRIVAYVDSVYSQWDDKWTPSAMTTITYDDATGMVTLLTANWDSYNEEWNNSEKQSTIYDSEGRQIYIESYRWSYDYNNQSYYWYGTNKAEYGYNERGNLIMTASYYWSRYDTVWVGNYKNESDYDEYGNKILDASYNWSTEKQAWYGSYRKYEYAYDSNGNQTLYAQYKWDDDKWAWVGVSRSENEFDADGINIMSTYYNGTDTLGNWIGSSKSGYYTKNGIRYNEYYRWDNTRKDWRGENKSEYCYTDNYYMSTSYNWDDSEWCWVGSSRYEETYTQNSMDAINYIWDRTANAWAPDLKEQKEITETATTMKSVYTTSKWNGSNWVYATRETEETVWLANNNEDYELTVIETYNPAAAAWVKTIAIKMVHVYSLLSGVKDIPADLNISVADGMITVTAADNAAISVATAGGAQVTSGTGAVSAAVAPGIYLITVDGKTAKVIVR